MMKTDLLKWQKRVALALYVYVKRPKYFSRLKISLQEKKPFKLKCDFSHKRIREGVFHES